MRVAAIAAHLVVLVSVLHLGSSFVPTKQSSSQVAWSSSSVLAAVPQVNQWTILANGAVRGTSRGHPTIEDGDIITTSPLTVEAITLKDNMMVSTKSGSQYRLGKASVQQQKALLRLKSQAAAATAKSNNVAKAPPARNNVKAAAVKKAPAPKPAPKPVATKAPAPAPASANAGQRDMLQKRREAQLKYGLNGKTVGNGKYLLVGQQIRSSSRRSFIYYAYRADKDGLPTGERLTVKISDTYDRLERENKNYEMVTSGIFWGQFVKKVDFLPEAECSNGIGAKRDACALVLESGERNLRDLVNARENVGLKGTALRQAIVAIGQCVQAVHTSGLVWTDLKAENFVTTTRTLGDANIGIKGIDLESTVKAGGPPIDYSPEACPPEFAKEEYAGRGTDFKVGYNYDSWSFGILVYELAVGKSLFGKLNDFQIAKQLRQDDFEPDISAVEDDRLRDLISQCLQLDPRKRPEITQILLHPYFLTTGIGPFSF